MPDWPLPPPRQPLLSEPVPAPSGPSRLPAAQYAKLLVPTPELAAVPLPALVARRRPALLLAPQHEIVPFTGRERVLAELAGWMGGGGKPAVRLVHGAGGQGKTRLIREVAAGCTRAGWAVWEAGHPRSTATARATVDSAVLVVVDRADRWPYPALITLLGQAHRLWLGSGLTVRVLLTARAAGDWWAAVTHRITPWGDSADDHALPQLAESGSDRARLFAAAAERFAAALGTAPFPGGAPDLAGPDFATVLALHSAAVAAVDPARRGQRPPQRIADLSAYLLAGEGKRGQLQDFPSTAPPEAGLPNAGLPDAGLPDVFDEDLVALSLMSRPGAPLLPEPRDDGAPGEEPDSALAVVVEAACRWPVVRDALAALVRGCPEVVLTAHGATLARLAGIPGLEPDVLAAVEPLLPEQPRVERHIDSDTDLDIGAAAIGAVLARHRLPAVTDPRGRGTEHRVLSGRLADAGQGERALVEATAAVDEYRREVVPDGPGLAMALLGLHDRLTDLERNDEAVTVGREAVAACREAARLDPGNYRVLLAEVLGSLPVRLGATGHADEAATTAEEAVREYRQLAATDPERLPGLASALVNWAAFAVAAGQPDGTLAASEEGVALYRRITDGDPERYRDHFAMALVHHTLHLTREGRHEEALAAAEETADINRDLLRTDPRHLQQTANALTYLANALTKLGRDAEPVLKELVGLLRQLYRLDPGAHRVQLAAALTTLADRSPDTTPPTMTLVYRDEAVRLCRRLVETDPDAHLDRLAAALAKLAKALKAAGNRPKALDAEREAVTISRALAADRSDAHLFSFSERAIFLAIGLAADSPSVEVLDLIEESLAALRAVTTPSPSTRHLVGRALVLKANMLFQRGELDRALAPLDEGIGVLSALLSVAPSLEESLSKARTLRSHLRRRLGLHA